MKISAAVARSSAEPFSIEELELDEPREHEVLVRVTATGLCHTDIGMHALQPVVVCHLCAGPRAEHGQSAEGSAA